MLYEHKTIRDRFLQTMCSPLYVVMILSKVKTVVTRVISGLLFPESGPRLGEYKKQSPS